MTIQANFPAIKPSLMLDFANTKQLDSRITYTRASTATFYNGVTTSKAEENLLTYSQEFDNAAWTKVNSSVTANATTAPDGTSTAEKLLQTTADADHRLSIGLTAVASSVYTFSVYAKAGELSWLVLNLSDSANDFTYYDLQNGVLGTVDPQTSATITSVGSGWYRCTYTKTASASGSRLDFFLSTGNNVFSYAGANNTDGLFLWGAQVEQRSAVSAYTATTTQAITNYIPVLQSAASGVARFDNNPTTGESLGLLIEESRTNLQLNSELLTSNWSATRTNISSTTIVAPDGALTGSKLYTDSTASNTHFLTQSGYFITATGTITFSVYAKAAELSKIGLREGANTGSYATFNLTTGAVISSAGTGVVAAITSVGNGWYRVAMTLTNTGNSTFEIYLLPNSYTSGGPTVSFNGDGWSGLYIWGAQSENGAFATSYIPTVASQVTRAADAASMTGTNFSTWFNAAQGTVYAESTPTLVATATPLYAFSDNSGTTQNTIYSNQSTTNHLVVRVGNTTVVNLDGGTYVDNTSAKSAGAYKVNDFALSLNAGTVATDTDAVLPVVDRFFIGGNSGGTVSGAQTIKKIAYYPIRLSNTNLVALTS